MNNARITTSTGRINFTNAVTMSRFSFLALTCTNSTSNGPDVKDKNISSRSIGVVFFTDRASTNVRFLRIFCARALKCTRKGNGLLQYTIRNVSVERVSCNQFVPRVLRQCVRGIRVSTFRRRINDGRRFLFNQMKRSNNVVSSAVSTQLIL